MTEEIEPPKNDREEALARLKKKRDLHGHAMLYIVVNAAVWVVWSLTGTGYPWPAWITGGWGIALFLNTWEVYFRRPITESDIDREVKRLHSVL